MRIKSAQPTRPGRRSPGRARASGSGPAGVSKCQLTRHNQSGAPQGGKEAVAAGEQQQGASAGGKQADQQLPDDPLARWVGGRWVGGFWKWAAIRAQSGGRVQGVDGLPGGDRAASMHAGCCPGSCCALGCFTPATVPAPPLQVRCPQPGQHVAA
jgi:hypothetical protein